MNTAVANFESVAATFQRRTIITALSVLGVLVYLIYAWFAFDVSNLLAKAQPERAGLIALDSMWHKVHVTRDLRRGEETVAIEGERTSTYDTPPDWVVRAEGVTRIDLGDGYLVEIQDKTTRFTVPGYGLITAVASAEGVVTTYPLPKPDWLRDDPKKFDARPTTGRRVQASGSKIEVHRYFFGWENFWFGFSHPLHGKSFSEIARFVTTQDRLDPEVSNLRYAMDGFLGNPDWQHGTVFVALWETILMAVLGTLTAALIALPMAFLAASNFTPSVVVQFVVKRFFDFVRGIDNLIWSLIFIRAFGLGPLTGSLAIAITDVGSLGKLFAEALENIDGKQVEGVQSTGASKLQQYRFGVIPQILPVFISQGLYYLESNTRSATVIGALGAGGIGLVLVETIRTSLDWENVLYIILLTIGVVIVMDQLSSWLRKRLIQGRAA